MSLGWAISRAIRGTYTRLRGLVVPPTSNVSKIDIPYPPLFESVPPTPFRLAIPLAVTMGAFTFSACALVLHHWARIEDLPSAEALPPSSPQDINSTNPTSKSKDFHYVLHPLWHRVAVAGAYVTMAACAGVIFFSKRARYISRLHVLVAPKHPAGAKSSSRRRLFFQTCNNGKTQGHIIPISQCKIMLAASDKSLVFLKANGVQGVFRIGTAGGMIYGKAVPPSQVFADLARHGIPNEKLKPATKKS